MPSYATAGLARSTDGLAQDSPAPDNSWVSWRYLENNSERILNALVEHVSLTTQAVLLAGVNDSVDALAGLCERGFAAGVLPYYLHQLDRVAGTAHFEVGDERARSLHAALVARLPGYLVPRLVREIAGDTSKRPL